MIVNLIKVQQQIFLLSLGKNLQYLIIKIISKPNQSRLQLNSSRG